MKDSSRRKRTLEELEEVKEEERALRENKQSFLLEAKRMREDKMILEE
jgi:hypothetical protein